MIATCPLDDVKYTVIATEICTVLHNVAAILYYTILYYTILYYTIPWCNKVQETAIKLNKDI